MSRAHSYAQIDTTDHDDTATSSSSNNNPNHNPNHNALALARSQKRPDSASPSSTSKGKQTDRLGYAPLTDPLDQDDDDEFEDATEDSAMLKSIGASSSASSSSSSSSSSSPSSSSSSSSSHPHSALRSAPRHPVYSANDDDEDDNEISEAPPLQESSNIQINSITPTATATIQRNSGARTTNVSFLARLTGRQRPERDARRMLQSTIDGVFSNMSAKPRVEKPYEEELPPSYKTVALDVSPAYYETTPTFASGFAEDDDMLLVDGLPVGGLFGFLWNMIISMSFQFVGFFLTYLLHTSHATKQGSKSGLGITLISIGYDMMNGRLPDTDTDDSMDGPSRDSNTGYMGNTDPTPSSVMSLRSLTEYMWLSYLLMFLGFIIMVQSVLSFLRAKRAEMVLYATSSAALEAAVPANAAAGSLPATLATLLAESSLSSSGASSSSSSSSSSTPSSGSTQQQSPASTSIQMTTFPSRHDSTSAPTTVVVAIV